MPLVIDVDEAWFAASASALVSPGQFYTRALDNKPPGTAWFYWLTQRMLPGFQIADPRPTRIVAFALLILGAIALGRAVSLLRENRVATTQGEASVLGLCRYGWGAALAVVLVTALPVPEQLAVSSEVLALPILCLALAVFVVALELKRSFTPELAAILGAALAWGVLLKQTVIFFVIAAFGAAAFLWRARLLSGAVFIAALAGALVVGGGAIACLGLGPLWYWSVSYPVTVLAGARGAAFDQASISFYRVALFSFVCWPLLAGLWRARKQGFAKPSNPVLLVAWAWLGAGIASVVMGHGLFFHYFQFLVPALALFWGISLPLSAPWRMMRELVWLAAAHAVVCILVATPRAGVFWGTDLAYYQRLGQLITEFTRPDDTVFIWGGNALALAASGRMHATRFVTARFAVSEYATPETRAIFEKEFGETPPTLVVDLHERGDERFNYPLSHLPWLERKLRSQYQQLRVASVPWVTLYLREDRAASFKFETKGARNLAHMAVDMDPSLATVGFARTNAMIRAFISSREQVGKILRSSRAGGHGLLALERLGRAWNALEALAFDAELGYPIRRGVMARARAVEKAITREIGGVEIAHADSDLRLANETLDWVIERYRNAGRRPPLAAESIFWWASQALVELQPKALPVPSKFD